MMPSPATYYYFYYYYKKAMLMMMIVHAALVFCAIGVLFLEKRKLLFLEFLQYLFADAPPFFFTMGA